MEQQQGQVQMSRQFGGKRDLSPHKAFIEKLRYSLNSHSNLNQNIEHIKDFNIGELVLYGRIDTGQNLVFPRDKFMVRVNSENSQVNKLLLLDFVADAVNSMNSQIRKMLLTNSYGKMNFSAFEGERTSKAVGSETRSQFKTMSFKTGYKSPILEFDSYNKSVNSIIVDKIMSNKSSLRITDFNSFIAFISPLLEKISVDSPLTLNKYLKSTLLTTMYTGLAVEFGVENFQDDQAKEDDILSDPGYPTIVEIARQYGFYVDKNRPNRLVADLSSPIMMRYAANRQLTTQKEIFDKRFNRAGIESFDLFKLSIYRLYLNLARFKSLPQLTKNEFLYRAETKNYNDILKLYVAIRRNEEANIQNFSDSLLRERMQNDTLNNFLTFFENELNNLPKEPYTLSKLLPPRS